MTTTPRGGSQQVVYNFSEDDLFSVLYGYSRTRGEEGEEGSPAKAVPPSPVTHGKSRKFPVKYQ